VEADVSGALVQLGDTPGEPAPFQREVPAGLYRLRVHKAGHRLVASASPDAPFAARPRTGHLATLDLERPLDEELRILERHRILQALEAEGGNQTRAAARLRMPRRTLVSRLASLGIDGPRRRRRGPAPPADDKE
jgi:DNA-binding NtrC family response regulator